MPEIGPMSYAEMAEMAEIRPILGQYRLAIWDICMLLKKNQITNNIFLNPIHVCFTQGYSLFATIYTLRIIFSCIK